MNLYDRVTGAHIPKCPPGEDPDEFYGFKPPYVPQRDYFLGYLVNALFWFWVTWRAWHDLPTLLQLKKPWEGHDLPADNGWGDPSWPLEKARAHAYAYVSELKAHDGFEQKKGKLAAHH